jgi:hypothetical protein
MPVAKPWPTSTHERHASKQTFNQKKTLGEIMRNKKAQASARAYGCSWHSPKDGARLVVSRAEGRNRELCCSPANGGAHG